MLDVQSKIKNQKYWMFIVPVIVIVCLLLCRRQQADDPNFRSRVDAYEQQIHRLAGERDSLLRALALREREYQHVADSLNAVIVKIQTVQTQNRKRYENRRDSIVVMSDTGLYRTVADYIERYRSRAER